jgi:hypothetical protein
MCVEDVVISRGTYIKATSVAANTTVNLTANLDRIAISVETHGFSNSRVMLARGRDTSGNSSGFQIGACVNAVPNEKIGEVKISADYRQYPGLIQEELSVSCIGAAGVILEHIMTPDLARAVRRAEDKLLHG